jgi:transposase, IS5 family
MIKMRRAQLSFGDGLIADEVKDLREEWMEHADEVLSDEAFVVIQTDAPNVRVAKAIRSGFSP